MKFQLFVVFMFGFLVVNAFMSEPKQLEIWQLVIMSGVFTHFIYETIDKL